MNIQTSIFNELKNYANFSGRASRSQYWGWCISMVLISLALTTLTITVPNIATAAMYLQVAVIPPVFAVSIRRLHDLDKSGRHYLRTMIPLIGPFVMLVWSFTKGTEGVNRFGPDPLVTAA